MLIITTKVEEVIQVEHGGEILEIRVTARRGNYVKLGFTAERSFRIRHAPPPCAASPS